MLPNKTLKDYYKYKQSKELALFENENVIIDLPYYTDYIMEKDNLDIKTIALYGDRILLSDDFTEVDKILKASLFSTEYKFNGLYDLMNTSYNPLDNVSAFETITRSYGTHTETEDIGGHTDSSTDYTQPFDIVGPAPTETNSNTSVIGDKTNTKTFSEKIDSETITRNGNIGVTSSQELVKQQREILNYEFYPQFFKHLVNEISFAIDKEE